MQLFRFVHFLFSFHRLRSVRGASLTPLVGSDLLGLGSNRELTSLSESSCRPLISQPVYLPASSS
jgi:hypothetical protein